MQNSLLSEIRDDCSRCALFLSRVSVFVRLQQAADCRRTGKDLV